MSVEVLSRVQFGVTIGIHYLFPVTTLGLTLFILILETLGLFRKDGASCRASAFLTKVLGLVFLGGVATGLLLPVEIGANWARFARSAGPVFGPILSLEAMLAFALESAFLAVLLFGRDKVSPVVLWFSAACVFLGSHFSAFLIVASNSWMQTPAGYVVENGQVMLTSLRAAIFNPSTVLRLLHVLTAAWLTGAFVTCAMAAYYAARQLQAELSRTLFRMALPVAFLTALAQPMTGHFHIMNVAENVPEKVAAFEGVFQTTHGAPMYLFGVPDQANRTVHVPVAIPGALSFLESGSFHSEVRGLNEFPEACWPPVNVVFTSFHLMVVLGVLMIGVTGLGVFLLWRGRLAETRWYLLLLPFLAVLPYLANEIGWMTAEIGRQTWAIHNLLRTAGATSASLPAWQVAASLTGIATLYVCVAALTLFFVCRTVRQGAGHSGRVRA